MTGCATFLSRWRREIVSQKVSPPLPAPVLQFSLLKSCTRTTCQVRPWTNSGFSRPKNELGGEEANLKLEQGTLACQPSGRRFSPGGETEGLCNKMYNVGKRCHSVIPKERLFSCFYSLCLGDCVCPGSIKRKTDPVDFSNVDQSESNGQTKAKKVFIVTKVSSQFAFLSSQSSCVSFSEQLSVSFVWFYRFRHTFSFPWNEKNQQRYTRDNILQSLAKDKIHAELTRDFSSKCRAGLGSFFSYALLPRRCGMLKQMDANTAFRSEVSKAPLLYQGSWRGGELTTLENFPTFVVLQQTHVALAAVNSGGFHTTAAQVTMPILAAILRKAKEKLIPFLKENEQTNRQEKKANVKNLRSTFSASSAMLVGVVHRHFTQVTPPTREHLFVLIRNQT